MYRKLILYSGLFLSIFSLSAPTSVAQNGEVVKLSLQEAIEFGLENFVDIRDRERDVSISEQQVREALSIGYPQLNASFSYSNYVKLPTSLVPSEFFGDSLGGGFQEITFGTKHNVNAGVELSQLVFDGSYVVGVKSSKIFVDLTRKTVDITKRDVRYKIQKAYQASLIAQAAEQLILNNMDNLTKVRYETNELYSNGFVEQLDVDRLDYSLNRLELDLMKTRRSIDLSHNLLKYQMGMAISQPIELTDSLKGLLDAATPIMRPYDFNYINREEMKLIEIQKVINDKRVKYYRSEFYPKLYVFGSLTADAQRDDFDFFKNVKPWYPTALFGFEIKAPLFDGFYRNSRVEQAKLQLEGIYLNEERLKNSIDLEIQQASANYNNAVELFEMEMKNLGLAEKIYNTALTKYNEGVGSSLELFDGERQLYQAQSSVVQSAYELLDSRTDLEKALGKL